MLSPRKLVPPRTPASPVLLACFGVALALGVASSSGPGASSYVMRRPGVAVSGRYVVAGAIYAMVRVGGAVYVGGEFSRIANRTGSAVVVPAAGGAIEPIRAEIAGGSVKAAVADGAGGWYVGGSFTTIGDSRRDGLAHLRPDGTLDPAFAPRDLGDISALALAGGVLYVGSGSVVRAVDAATGAVLPVAYEPLEGAGVSALLADAGRLYVAFGKPGAAAYDAVSGTRLWAHRLCPCTPNDAGALTLARDDGRLLVGGGFDDGRSKNLEVLNAGGGTPTGRRVQVPKTVRSIAVVSGTVYLAHDPRRRGSSGLATINLATGALRSWGAIDPSVLAVEGRTLYMDGRERRVYSARAGTAHAALRPVSPPLSNSVLALAPQGGHVLVGGSFTGAGGPARHNLAAFDARTGALLAWRPNASDGGCCGVSALAAAGRTIYVAGYFKRVSGAPRTGLAAVSADGKGRLLPWRPRLVDWFAITALAVSRGRVFVGASELVLPGPTPKRGNAPPFVHLVAFSDRGAGARLRFSPRLGSEFEVNALAVWHRTLLVGGQSLIAFSVDGDGRHELWRRQTDLQVFAFATRGTTLYAGGNFTQVSRRRRSSLAAFALDRRGALLPFAPAVPIDVSALAPLGRDLVFGGEDPDVRSPQVLGAVVEDGGLEPWGVDVPPGSNYSVDHIAHIEGGLLVAGGFDWLGPAGQQAAGGIGWLR
jgi:hypothetical protein